MITLVMEKSINEQIYDMEFYTEIHLDNHLIGDISGTLTEDDLHIELLMIDKPYRRKGYGTIVIELLKKLCKDAGLSNINAECRGELISFYEKLGADFNPRCEDDITYINNRFYIDLN